MLTLKPTQFASREEFEAALIQEATNRARREADAEWQASERTRKLATLHKELGYDSVKELIDELRNFLPGGAKKSSEGSAKGEKKRSRTTLTDEIRAEVKRRAAAGEKAPSIAKAVGISTPTAYNILKA